MDIKRELLVVLLIGISAAVASDICPFVDNLPDCWCVKMPDGVIRIYCNGFTTEGTIEDTIKLLKESNFDRKQSIELIFNRFKGGKLSSRIFEGFHVTSLAFEECNLTWEADEEGDGLFVGQEDSLEKLTFFKTTLNNGKSPMKLGHLRELRELKFTGSNLDSFNFGSDWYREGLSHLEVLHIRDFMIFGLDDRMFAKFENLRDIDLSFLELSKVKRSMFPNPAQHLEKIALVRNMGLQVLPDDMFTNMPSLTSVNLARTHIKTLEETVWKPVWSNLHEVIFDTRQISCEDSINWTFKVKPPKKIIGNCDKPSELRDTTLLDFIMNKQDN